MNAVAAIRPAVAELRACTVCRDIRRFGLLAAELDDCLGGAWAGLELGEAAGWLAESQRPAVEFVVLALDAEDEPVLEDVAGFVLDAIAQDLRVLIVARDLGPAALHRLLSLGADGFLPYPLPEGALRQAVARPREPAAPPPPPKTGGRARRNGLVLPVHGLGGGLGATTFAVNLAWELETVTRTDPPRVCLLDLDLQFGSTATYLDLPKRDAVMELLSNIGEMDAESFQQAMAPFESRLRVLPPPPEMLPLDFIGPQDVARLIEEARAAFDYVVIDMPKAVTHWTETVLGAAHVYFAVLERDMRSATNALRLIRTLKADDLPADKLRFVLNRAPGLTDFEGKGRVRRLAETLEVGFDVQLPHGGRAVTECAEHGRPLALKAARNPLRKAIRRLASSLHELNASVTGAA